MFRSNRSPFRRQSRRASAIRLTGWTLVVGTALLLVRGVLSRPVSDIQSGQYVLCRIEEDLALTVGKSQEGRQFEVGWLGVEITQPVAARHWLDDHLEDRRSIEVRFDRRRLDERGKLVAYFFHGEELLNESLIRRGFANPATHPADHAPLVRRLNQATASRANSVDDASPSTK